MESYLEQKLIITVNVIMKEGDYNTPHLDMDHIKYYCIM